MGGGGLLGTITVYSWFVKRVKNCENINKIAFICAVIVGGLTYSYFVNWVWMVVFMMSLKERNCKGESNEE